MANFKDNITFSYVEVEEEENVDLVYCLCMKDIRNLKLLHPNLVTPHSGAILLTMNSCHLHFDLGVPSLRKS